MRCLTIKQAGQRGETQCYPLGTIGNTTFLGLALLTEWLQSSKQEGRLLPTDWRLDLPSNHLTYNHDHLRPMKHQNPCAKLRDLERQAVTCLSRKKAQKILKKVEKIEHKLHLSHH